ncbi:MAG: hypothetical protein K8I03_10810 [Ignavibacteria bacterium]|nr:hypothetical protein [Ignavibacteria bacterium]
MIKLIPILLLVFISMGSAKSQGLVGSYYFGDSKISIVMDDFEYFVVHADGMKNKLTYEENTPENDQIWVESRKGNTLGHFVMKSDYSSGIYTDYSDGKEQFVKKIN